MTAKLVWEGLLTELSKVNAPSMLLLDFNYFFNKSINQYINKRYNLYDTSQQTTDDLRVLKSEAFLEPTKAVSKISEKFKNLGAGKSKIFGATYEVNLPLDYLHILNCICIYKVNDRYKCYDAGDEVLFAAKRLTSDSWSVIVNDYYNRPLPERPYYYIHNINTSDYLPTNPINTTDGKDLDYSVAGTDVNSDYPTVELKYNKVEVSDADLFALLKPLYTTDGTSYTEATSYTAGTNYYKAYPTLETKSGQYPRTISLGGNITNKSLVEKEAGVRYGNSNNVRLEIRYGHDDSVFQLIGVFIDYIKAPLTIRLTQELVNLTRDTSLIMEFPDYVCQEIINELVHLVMENTADPRLQTHIPVTQSIANPAQQLTAPQQSKK